MVFSPVRMASTWRGWMEIKTSSATGKSPEFSVGGMGDLDDGLGCPLQDFLPGQVTQGRRVRIVAIARNSITFTGRSDTSWISVMEYTVRRRTMRALTSWFMQESTASTTPRVVIRC